MAGADHVRVLPPLANERNVREATPKDRPPFASYFPDARFAKYVRTAFACAGVSIQAVFLCSGLRVKFARRYARMSLPEMFSSVARVSGRTYLTVAIVVTSPRSFVVMDTVYMRTNANAHMRCLDFVKCSRTFANATSRIVRDVYIRP